MSSSSHTFSFKNRNDDDNDLNVNLLNPVDNFFDNIADYEEDFSFIQNNKDAFNFAMKKALENNSDSSTNNDFEDEESNYDNQSEIIVNTDIDTNLQIEQIK